MKLILTLFGVNQQYQVRPYGYHPSRPVPRPAFPAPPQTEHVWQGSICGEKTYDLEPGRKQTLRSPKYPQTLSEQLQCEWVITGLPGMRIRLDFKEFFLQKGGKDCHFTYLVINDEYGVPSADGLSSTGTVMLNKKASMNTYRMCGKNPGVVITQGNKLKLNLHSDQRLDPDGVPQRFDIKLSLTNEPATPSMKTGTLVVDDGTLMKRVPGGVVPIQPAPKPRKQMPKMTNFPGIHLKSAANARAPMVGNVNHNVHNVHNIRQIPEDMYYYTETADQLSNDESEEVESGSQIIIILALVGLVLGALSAFGLWKLHEKKSAENESKEEGPQPEKEAEKPTEA